MTQIVILLVLMTGSVIGCAAGKKRFEELLPITCAGIVLLLFLTGIFGVLKLGVSLVLLISFFLWILSLIWILRKKEWKVFLKYFLTPGCLVFVVLYFLLSILNRDMMVYEWDEFSHWADIVKVMVNIDDFGTNPNSGSLFASYPPGMALFQYFFQEIYLRIKPEEIFSEWRLYFAYQVFFLTFLMPFLKHLSFKEPLKILEMGITIWIGPMLIFSNIYSSLYIDAILGFVSSAGIATVFLQQKKDWIYDIYIYLSIVMLVLAKDAGMLFAAFLLILYITDIICNRIYKKEVINIQKVNILKIAFGIASMAIPKLLWSLNIKINGAATSFGNRVDVAELIRIVLGLEPENYRSSVAKLFSLAFMTHKIEIGDLAIQIPYIVLVVVFAGIVYWFYQKFKELEPEKARIRKIAVCLLLIQSILFVVGTCISYMYKFSENEALSLAGFSRYMRIMFHCWWIFILLMAVCFAIKGNEKKVRTEIFVFCIIMATVPWSVVSMNVTRQTVEHSIETRAPFQVIIDQIEKITKQDTEPSSITVICQETQGYEQLLFRFALRPHKIDWNYSIGEPFYDGDCYTETITAEEWHQRLINKRDYVALYKVNDYFVSEFASVFKNPDDIQENGVYRVNKKTGLLELCKGYE